MPASKERQEDELGLLVQISIYLGYAVFTVMGYLRDFIDWWLGNFDKPSQGYAPLSRDFENFFRRRMYSRMEDCFSRPVTGPAGGRIAVLDRDRRNNLKLTGKKYDCLNLSSYNYLGFAQPGSETEEFVLKNMELYGISTTSCPLNTGQTALHDELEKTVANFLGVEEAMVFGMGWGTNTTAIPALTGKGCLVISDSLNHNSIVVGARCSGSIIKTFPHNDTAALEKVVRRSIIEGQPRTHRPWKKILIIIEGVYSMEGEICPLAKVVEIKKKYKCYLYLDEAHSIGAVGVNGRGVCEHSGVNPKDIDVLMGTFTKSFGAIGGYVAGTKRLISAVRSVCASQMFSSGLSPPCAAQVLAAFRVICTDNGKKRMLQLIQNSNLLRQTLRERGFHVIGDNDSAVVPVVIGHPAKLGTFSRYCLEKGLAVVIVGFPATPLLLGRVRFCCTAAHTEEDIRKACDIITEAGKYAHCLYRKKILG